MTVVETLVIARSHDLINDFKVRRALPTARRRMIGPFVFLDQMGPELLRDGAGLDVPPHPHIGLATVTYLFDGELLHRDSLGTVAPIRAGDVNWMTAGRGIAHSERTPPDRRGGNEPLFGIQSWVALPLASEEAAPSFTHHDVTALPLVEDAGCTVRVIAGTGFGQTSPVALFSPLFYAGVILTAGATLPVDLFGEERGMFVVTGQVTIAGEAEPFGEGSLVVFRPDTRLKVVSSTGARLMLLGGDSMPEKRHVWWNFVSSSRERIEQAKEDWIEQRFGAVPDEYEFVPLPPGSAQEVKYP